jgi:hypothetical protein
MNNMRRWPSRHIRGLVGACALLVGAHAEAHLMVAQRGTLNLVDNAAYMVMSLPVSAFRGVDDDGDGLLSLSEGNRHIREIESQIREGVQLSSPIGHLPLEGVMITLSPSDSTPSSPAAQIVVVGRYALEGSNEALELRLSLFGKDATEQAQEITVTRGKERQRMVLGPGREQREVLPAAWSVFVDHARLGAEHVLGGMDHLLFLLVVLSTGWRFRQAAWALTCFTAGHAITLVACIWGGWMVPSRIVEPAIAATIIGMAVFDRWSRSRRHPWPPAVRLSLVFVCALIHGMGLAGALIDLDLDPQHLLLSLAGFNLGIESGQIGVAVLAAAWMAAARQLAGPTGPHRPRLSAPTRGH